MFSFKKIVVNVLKEQTGTPPQPGTNTSGQQQTQGTPPPQNQQQSQPQTDITKIPEFAKLFQAYKAKFGNIDLTKVNTSLNLLVPTSKRIAGKNSDASFIPILDAVESVINLLPPVEKNKPLTQIVQTISTKLTSDANFKNDAVRLIDNAVNQINSLTTPDPLEFEPTQPRIVEVWRIISGNVAKLSQVAIEQLGQDSIQTALNKIIAKRVDVFDRIMSLQGIRKPFSKEVIDPVLHMYKRYVSSTPQVRPKDWQKKIPADFAKIVDNISAETLLTIALLASDYYLYLLRETMPKNETQPEEQPQQEVNASLNVFTSLVNKILTETTVGYSDAYASGYDNINWGNRQQNTAPTNPPQPPAPQSSNNQQSNNQQSNSIDPTQFEQISKTIGREKMTDYESFLEKGTSQYLPGRVFNLQEISKDTSKPAKDLYNALKNIALYIRTGPNRKGYAQQAASAVMGFSGQSLYGGPS